MSCLIDTGWTLPACGDRFTAPGILSEDIWVFNHSDITDFTVGANPKEISALVLTGTGVKIALHRNTGMNSHELVSDENGNYYNATATGKSIDTSSLTSEAIEDMVDVPIVMIMRGKDGVFRLLGKDGDFSLTGDDFTTGAKTGDERGATLTWTGVENARPFEFFDTSIADTIVTLDGYLI